jgi:hypothetical protein
MPADRGGFQNIMREAPMELVSFLHLPISVLGCLLFLFGLVLIRVVRHAAQRPQPPRWLRGDMVCLLAGTAISLPISLGIGFMLTALVELATDNGETPLTLLAAVVVGAIGWRIAKRSMAGAQPA